MAKAIMSKSWNVIFKEEQNCSNFDRALNIAEDKLADMWAKNIGLKTMQEMSSFLDIPLYGSIEKLLGIITNFGRLREPIN